MEDLENLKEENKNITLSSFLALSFADIDIFLLKEENQIDDKKKFLLLRKLENIL